MNRWVNALVLILVIQCALVAAFYWPGQKPLPATQKEHRLASFDAGMVDEIRIGDEFDNEAALTRSGEHWLLAYLEGLPASRSKVEQLLEAISDEAHDWPVAHTSAARQRFQVADYYYQRRLTVLGKGKVLGTIYLGTSPGFRKVYARNEKQDEIYSIGFNVFDAPAISGAWLEPDLLQVRTPLRIDADSYSVHFNNGIWLSGTGGTPDPRELEALITALRNLQVDGVADFDMQRELSLAEASLELAVHSLVGEIRLELFLQDGQHYIHSSEYSLFFKISPYDFDLLTGIAFRLISGELIEE